MAFNFPASPTEGQQFTPPGGPTYQYNAPKWLALAAGFNAGNIPFTPVGDISSSTVQGAIAELATEPKGWRNRIINGDFAIDQRNNGAAVDVTTVAYGVDRWFGVANSPGVIRMQRSADPVNIGQYVFTLSVPATDASLTTTDFYAFDHKIEGYNVRDFNWGSAQAKAITISFWVKGNAAYTLPLSIRNAAYNRTWNGSFSVTTGWAKVTMTVPGDVTGTWEKTNLAGMDMSIVLGVGSTYHGVAGWQAGNLPGLAGMSNFMAGGSNVLEIKEFQLEKGSVATEFERVDYSEQLRRCQRYYEIVNCVVGTAAANATATNQMGWKAEKRAIPTLVVSFDAGSGGNFIGIANSTLGIYQHVAHSQIATGTIRGSAEL